MPDSIPRTCFIVNPKSAGGRTGKRWNSYSGFLSRELKDHTVRQTRHQGDGVEQTRRALEEGYELIVSVGGDGTNNEVINGFFKEDGTLLHPSAAFAFFPSGSGGDLRRTLPPPSNLEELIYLIKHGSNRLLDIGRTEFTGHDGKPRVQHFLNIASIGLSGMICNHVNASSKPFGGSVAFYLATARSLFQYTSPRVTMKVDDGPEESMEIQTIAVANGRYFGGGMKIAPDADMTDGIFDITVLRKTGPMSPILHTKHFYTGTQAKLPYVSMTKGKRVEIRSEEEVHIELDGETPGRLPIVFSVLPQILPYRSSLSSWG